MGPWERAEGGIWIFEKGDNSILREWWEVGGRGEIF